MILIIQVIHSCGGKNSRNNRLGQATWITHLGTSTSDFDNSGADVCEGITVDETGNVFCAGHTNGNIGETNGGNRDVFVMKISSHGSLKWLTHLGATSTFNSNSGNDYCYDVTLDSSGNVYCAGVTYSNMGETNAGYGDAFVVKLDSGGNLKRITHLGTTTKYGTNTGDDVCKGVAADDLGNIYCAGYSDGDIGETNAGNSDAFIMKINSIGSLMWLTHLGTNTKDNDNAGTDECSGVAVDGLGNVYCAGYTTGDMGESNGGGDDAFIMKLDSNGNILWLTHFGSVTVDNNNLGNDRCMDVAVDNIGNVYCAGHTTGDMGESNGGGYDAFVLKLDFNGNKLWLTQLGADTKINSNAGNDRCEGVAVDSSGNVYCSGHSDGDIGEANGGSDDAFTLKMDSNGELVKLIHHGVSTKDNSNSGYDRCQDVAVGSSGYVYCGGYTDGNMGEANSGNSDAFVLKDLF